MKIMSDKSHRHPAQRTAGQRGGRKTPEALARLHSGGSLNRSHAFTAGGRGSSLAPTGRRSFNDMPLPNPFLIADAKAATDAMAVRGFGHYMREIYTGSKRLIRWRIYFPHGQMVNLDRYVEASASTEELARSAAALLAAEAMRGKL